MANSASSLANMSVPYLRQRGRMSSQSEPLRKTKPSSSSSFFSVRNRYSSPLHTHMSPSRRNGCMPSSCRPMMASRWKPSQPSPAFSTRVMSGPRDTVRSKNGRNSSGERASDVKPMIEHISVPPVRGSRIQNGPFLLFKKRRKHHIRHGCGVCRKRRVQFPSFSSSRRMISR